MSEQIILDEDDNDQEGNSIDDCSRGNEPKGVSSQDEILNFITGSLSSDLNLDEKDIKIVSSLFHNLLRGRNGIKAINILNGLEKDRIAAFMEIHRLERLKNAGVIEADYSDDAAVNTGRLLCSTLKLSVEFLNRLCNCSEKPVVETKKAYDNNNEYLADQFERMGILMEVKNINIKSHRYYRALRNGQPKKGLSEIESRITERLRITDKVFPVEELKKMYGLNPKEEIIILSLLYKGMSESRLFDRDSMLDMISETPHERLLDMALFREDGKLLKKGLLIIRPSFGGEESIVLNPELKAWLFGERKKWKKKRPVKRYGFFELVKPNISLDKAILPERTKSIIQTAIDTINGDTSQRLRKWGVKTDMLSENSSHGVLMLFYGSPGTGKTFAAHALAHEVKRHVLIFDCSMIVDKYVGESEKNTRMIFDRYKALSKKLKSQPVLLLNEADQFLHKRISASRSADHMYNQMQNIFLEQMEKFSGILIATTNLLENLDEAFSRRFHHKIEFKRPGAEERLRLWEIHIPEKTPLSGDINIKYLAEKYDLSGGQIVMVMRNALRLAARRGDMLCQGDLINACEDEINTNFDEKGKRRLGF